MQELAELSVESAAQLLSSAVSSGLRGGEEVHASTATANADASDAATNGPSQNDVSMICSAIRALATQEASRLLSDGEVQLARVCAFICQLLSANNRQ